MLGKWERRIVKERSFGANGGAMERASEKKYYTSKELAEIMGMSVKWLEKWRHRIVGAGRLGRLWRFDKAMIDARIRTGKSIII